MTSSPSLRWLSWVAVVALFVGTSGKLDRKKLFDRMMRLKHVLEKPMMVVFDCKESRMTQDVLDRLESLRDRIKIYTAEESGNEIGSKLQINPEKCLSVAMFPKWLSMLEAADQSAYELRVEQSAADLQDWAWERLSERASAKIVNDSPRNISVYWIHVVNHERVLQVEIAAGSSNTMNTFVGHVFEIRDGTRNKSFEVLDTGMHFKFAEKAEDDVSERTQKKPKEEASNKVKEMLQRSKKKIEFYHREASQELKEAPDAKSFKPQLKKELSSKTRRLLSVAIISVLGIFVVVAVMVAAYITSKRSLATSGRPGKQGGTLPHTLPSTISKKVKRMTKRNID
ncbi:hypothetical protein AAMO2058_000658200 [Amorphochlora amoebiformis]